VCAENQRFRLENEWNLRDKALTILAFDNKQREKDCEKYHNPLNGPPAASYNLLQGKGLPARLGLAAWLRFVAARRRRAQRFYSRVCTASC
jgi:hypothetical protein